MTKHTPHAAVFLTNGQPQRVFVGDFTDCTNEVLKWEQERRADGHKDIGGSFFKDSNSLTCEIFETQGESPDAKAFMLIAECTAMLNQTADAYGLYRFSISPELQNEDHPWVCSVCKCDYDGREIVVLSADGKTPMEAVQEIHLHVTGWAATGKIPQ